MGNIFDWMQSKWGKEKEIKVVENKKKCPDHSEDYQQLYDSLMGMGSSLDQERMKLYAYASRTYSDAPPPVMMSILPPPENTASIEGVKYASDFVSANISLIGHPVSFLDGKYPTDEVDPEA